MARKSVLTKFLDSSVESDPSSDKELEIVATDIFFRNQESKKRIIVNRGSAGSSKCLIPGTEVVMFDGHLKKIEDIKVGDLVMGADSCKKEVLEVHSGYGPLYRVDQSKFMSYTVNEHHLLSLTRGNSKRAIIRKRKKGERLSYRYENLGQTVTIPVKDYLNTSGIFQGIFLGYRKIVDFSHKQVSIDPYFLGLWLGDGDSHRAGITTMDSEIVDYLFEYAKVEGLNLQVGKKGKSRSYGKADSYHLSNGNYKGGSLKHRNPLLDKLRYYNLIKNKHIPDEFLYTDRKSRLQLLAGLIDSDGYLCKSKRQKGCSYQVGMKDEKLTKQIYYLANSLGFKCSLWKLKTGIKSLNFVSSAWLVRIIGDITDIPVRIKRKKAFITKHNSTLINKIKSITYVGEGEYVGFSLEGDGLFFLRDFTVVHNSYSLCQLMLYKFFNESNKKFFICRKNLPALRQSCYMVLNQLASEYRVRDEIIEEKVHLNWYYGTNLIHFGGLDDPEKVKSSEWNYIWMEEATEFTYEDFKILLLRLRAATKDGNRNQMFLSFNPIDEFHWIKTKVLENPEYDAEEIHSTYKDNPFLDEDARHDLDNLEKVDPSFYNIYSLGNWGKLENLIYRNWDIVDWVPDIAACERVGYGLDFGYNDPTVLLRVSLKGKDAYIEEIIHATHLTSSQLIQVMQERMPSPDIRRKQPIYADPSRPEEIEELKKAGFYVKPAVRSIVPGIDSVKRYRVHILSTALNSIKEFRSYSWKKDKWGNIVDEPVNAMDHSCVSGGTIIHTVEGDVPIKQLVGKTGLVYCYDFEKNRIGVREFTNVRKTRKDADVIRVHLDDGTSVTLTPDHKVLLRTREWCEAKDLQPKQSLMPFYQYYIKGKKTQVPEYLVLSCGDRDDRYSHRIVYENCIGSLPEDSFDFNVHHKDENGLNNDPFNLELVTRAHHASIHKKGNLYSEAKRKKFTLAMQEAEKHRSVRFLQRRLEALHKARIASKEWHNSEEGRTWHSDHWKNSLSKIVREKVINQCQRCGDEYKTSRLNQNHSLFCSECGAIGYRELREAKYGMTDGKRRKLGLTKKEGISPLVEGGPCIVCGSAFQVPKNLINRKFLCEQKECRRKYATKKQKEKRKYLVNHKVVSIERIRSRDVYNMEVEGTYNFAANGIYLHNCDAARYFIHTATRGAQGVKIRWL